MKLSMQVEMSDVANAVNDDNFVEFIAHWINARAHRDMGFIASKIAREVSRPEREDVHTFFCDIIGLMSEDND